MTSGFDWAANWGIQTLTEEFDRTMRLELCTMTGVLLLSIDIYIHIIHTEIIIIITIIIIISNYVTYDVNVLGVHRYWNSGGRNT